MAKATPWVASGQPPAYCDVDAAAQGDIPGAEANVGGAVPPRYSTGRQPFTRRRIDVNSPYTKHLDAIDGQTHHHHSTAMTVPTYAAAPMQSPAPVIVQSGSNDGGNGSKAGFALLAILLAVAAAIAGFAFARGSAPSWNELRRYEALSGREGEVRGRDAGWNQGRKQGQTEMKFLAQYEKLRTQASAFGQGYRQGRNIGQQMGADRYRNRYSGYGGGYSRGYGGYRGYRGSSYGRGYGYGGSVGGAIASAQGIANATGSPVDVIVG